MDPYSVLSSLSATDHTPFCHAKWQGKARQRYKTSPKPRCGAKFGCGAKFCTFTTRYEKF